MNVHGKRGAVGLVALTNNNYKAPNEPITLQKLTKPGKITPERVIGCKPHNIFVFSPPCCGSGFVTDGTWQLRIFLAALLGLRRLFWKKEQKSCFTFAEPDSFTAGRGNRAVWISIYWTLLIFLEHLGTLNVLSPLPVVQLIQQNTWSLQLLL